MELRVRYCINKVHSKNKSFAQLKINAPTEIDKPTAPDSRI